MSDSDLVKRLRDNVTEWLYEAEDDGRGYVNDAPFEAADAIERLTRERDEARDGERRKWIDALLTVFPEEKAATFREVCIARAALDETEKGDE